MLAIILDNEVSDNTLRKLDEARFNLYTTGNGNGLMEMHFSLKSNPTPVKLRIVSGTGELYYTQGGEAYQELEFTAGIYYKAYAKVSSDCIIGIDNCQSVLSLGYLDTDTRFLFNRLDATNSPTAGFDMSEMMYFGHCTDMFIVFRQPNSIKGDISSFAGMSSRRLIIEGDINNPVNITGDIAEFKDCAALTFIGVEYTNVSGDASALENLPLTQFRCRGTRVSGNLNKLPATLDSFSHSVYDVEIPVNISFDFSAGKPKASTLRVWDHIGAQLTGNFEDIIDTAKTSAMTLICGAVSSPVNTDVYSLLRKSANRNILNVATNFGAGSTLTFSGSIASLTLTKGVNTFSILGANIPATNAVEILNCIGRGTIPSGTKNITMRSDSQDTNLAAAVSNLQSKGYTVTILPMI